MFGETAPNLCRHPWKWKTRTLFMTIFGYLISKLHKEACLHLIQMHKNHLIDYQNRAMRSREALQLHCCPNTTPSPSWEDVIDVSVIFIWQEQGFYLSLQFTFCIYNNSSLFYLYLAVWRQFMAQLMTDINDKYFLKSDFIHVVINKIIWCTTPEIFTTNKVQE